MVGARWSNLGSPLAGRKSGHSTRAEPEAETPVPEPGEASPPNTLLLGLGKTCSIS